MKDGDTSWLHREFIRARETPPAPDAVMAIVSTVSQPEAVENKKAVATLLLGMRSWLQQAAAIDWKPAEFEAVAEMFTRFGSYDLLRDYAEAARRRDPANPAWRFHAIVARNQGDPYRLTAREEDELDTLAEGGGRTGRFPHAQPDQPVHGRGCQPGRRCAAPRPLGPG